MMNAKLLTDCCELAAVLARETDWTPYALANLVNTLRRLGTRYARYMEADCNRSLTEAERCHVEKLEVWIADILPPGIRAKFQGDPRGVTVKLVLPSGRTNDWGAEGWCVPGS